jgi:hypothetical protein
MLKKIIKSILLSRNVTRQSCNIANKTLRVVGDVLHEVVHFADFIIIATYRLVSGVVHSLIDIVTLRINKDRWNKHCV